MIRRSSARSIRALFDWSIEPVPGMDYRMVKTVETDEKGTPTQTGGGINGGIVKRPDGYDVHAPVNYVNVRRSTTR